MTITTSNEEPTVQPADKNLPSPFTLVPAELAIHIFNYVDPISSQEKQRYPEVCKFFYNAAKSKESFDETISKKLMIELIGVQFANELRHPLFSYKHMYRILKPLIINFDISSFIGFIDDYVSRPDIVQNDFIFDHDYKQPDKDVEQTLLNLEAGKISKLSQTLQNFGLSKESCNQFLALLIAKYYLDPDVNPDGIHANEFVNIYCKYGYSVGLCYFIEHEAAAEIGCHIYLKNIPIALENRRDTILEIILELTKKLSDKDENIYNDIIEVYFDTPACVVSRNAFSIIIKFYPEIAEILTNDQETLFGNMRCGDYFEQEKSIKKVIPSLLTYQCQLINQLKEQNAELRKEQENTEVEESAAKRPRL